MVGLACRSTNPLHAWHVAALVVPAAQRMPPMVAVPAAHSSVPTSESLVVWAPHAPGLRHAVTRALTAHDALVVSLFRGVSLPPVLQLHDTPGLGIGAASAPMAPAFTAQHGGAKGWGAGHAPMSSRGNVKRRRME